MDQTVLIHEKQGIAFITLNRPDSLNAMDLGVLERLSRLLDEAVRNQAVKAVIITGSGNRAFSAGADVGFLNRATAFEVREFARLAVSINHKIETLGKVVVAALNGFALGGGLEMAESCTIRIAGHTAQLGHPEVRIGSVAGLGGTTRLPRLVGKGRAAELLLRGRIVAADEALQIGWVQSVVQAENLLGETEVMVREILAQSPIAVRLTWEALHRGLNMTLEESALLWADYFGLAASTDDFRAARRLSSKRRRLHSPDGSSKGAERYR